MGKKKMIKKDEEENQTVICIESKGGSGAPNKELIATLISMHRLMEEVVDICIQEKIDIRVEISHTEKGGDLAVSFDDNGEYWSKLGESNPANKADSISEYIKDQMSQTH